MHMTKISHLFSFLEEKGGRGREETEGESRRERERERHTDRQRITQTERQTEQERKRGGRERWADLAVVNARVKRIDKC